MVDSSEKAFLKQLPDLQTYEGGDFYSLPFVKIVHSCGQYEAWHPPGDSLEPLDAYRVGYECASHYAQWTKDNPSGENILMSIIESMGQRIASHGVSPYERGFSDYIQEMVEARAQAVDIHQDTAQTHENYMRFRRTMKLVC